MTVSELIEVLKRYPEDAPVFVAYDYAACVISLEPDQIIKAGAGAVYGKAGVWLCGMTGDEVAYVVEGGNAGNTDG